VGKTEQEKRRGGNRESGRKGHGVLEGDLEKLRGGIGKKVGKNGNLVGELKRKKPGPISCHIRVSSFF